MSRLRELRVHGFKSFADQTRFVFEPGVNAVIGPNGSGKSNMADAVRWVLGEQSNRSLRTRRADDVIFGGSDQRKPQGMAEATLTLDNADGWLPIDFTEVSIGRRAYRSGESEYLINGARARLRDVVELLGQGRLGANELVVVGQGTVDAALSLRPEERRQLFEEAAGVKGLQVKRNEASGRLTRTLDNLTRVSDLIGELKPQVRRLALQAEHQQQHDTLGARARALVAVSIQRRERAARAELGDARRRAAAAESALVTHRDEQQAGRAAVTAAEERYWAAEESARAAAIRRQEIREELIRLDGRLESINRRVSEVHETFDRETNELAAAEASLASIDERGPGADIEPAVAAAAAAEAEWRSAVVGLASADDELLGAEQAVSELRARHSDLIARRARASEESARHAARIGQLQEERSALEGHASDARSQAAGARARADEAAGAAAAARDALEALADERDGAQEADDRARHAVVALTERLQATRAELDALAMPHDAATRLGRRLASSGWPTLLDAISVPEAAWPAIEAVIGGDLDSALLWSDRDPIPEVTDGRGAARLLAPSSPGSEDERRAALDAVKAHQTLADWIDAPSAPRALTRTVVAPDLSALLDGWRRLPDGWTAVTPDGELADARGVVLRGRADPPGSAAARAHARRRDLIGAVDTIERDLLDGQRAAHDAAEALRAIRDRHLDAQRRHDEADRQARSARDAQLTAEDALGRLDQRLEAVHAQASKLAEPPAAAELPKGDVDDAGDLDQRQDAADRARTRRNALAERRDAAREAWTMTRRAAEHLETRTAGMRSERANLEVRVAQLREALLRLRTTLETLTAERSGTSAPADDLRERQQAADAEQVAAEKARQDCRAELVALEREHGGTGDVLARLEQAMQSAAVEVSRRDEALAGLIRERDLALENLPEQASDDVLADDGLTAELEALEAEQIETELRRVRRTLSQIGSVNPFAVEEHTEFATRLEEMTDQDADLRTAIASTEELIATLDGEIAVQFDAAFRAIGSRFDEYCQLLFAGGSGSLQMADESDGDAPGGIEIVVRPPGKRLQRLSMLSGGERALTGVALLFAMLTVNPVPFCILDEVDAALDEANIGRFADALRKLSEAIDFVVITHNRATIEVADTIYGVTMTDAAVSRVLSLRLADVPVEANA
ncbi:MAG: chromosome segregation protein SMC [Candidatus Limnocylindria bacterium]